MAIPDTIAAIATAPGHAGIGVVRVSGGKTGSIVRAITGRSNLAPRQAVLTRFLDAEGRTLDQGIALFFASPHSYTGEDVLEIQAHGGPVVQRLLLQRCIQAGARLAAPGEFTQRAFLNGKMDLAQAESVIDLIDATTAQAARSAVNSLQGDFSRRIEALTREITDLRALTEATLDFPEEDISGIASSRAEHDIRRIRTALALVIQASRQGALLRDGVRIALAGAPNVGKSSLLNRLVGSERAIVTAVPGTTRDTLREAIEIEGVPLHIVDTAGLRGTQDPVERMGIERAWSEINSADAVILVHDASVHGTQPVCGITARIPAGVAIIHAMNKVDLSLVPFAAPSVESVVWVSAKTGEGMDALREAILSAVGWRGHDETVFMARERHLTALYSADEHLAAAQEQVGPQDILAEELRLAQNALSTITGAFTADDLLGQIFERFCIGK